MTYHLCTADGAVSAAADCANSPTIVAVAAAATVAPLAAARLSKSAER
jgi:hypothetical protein